MHAIKSMFVHVQYNRLHFTKLYYIKCTQMKIINFCGHKVICDKHIESSGFS